MASVLQEWVQALPLMQQTVLLMAMRGPDGRSKLGAPNALLRWYRRCVLLSAFDGEVLTDPYDLRGGHVTGPSLEVTPGPPRNLMIAMEHHVVSYLKVLDAIPAQFQNDFRDAAMILGYRHPNVKISEFWRQFYRLLVQELNLMPETFEHMNKRLGDNLEHWLSVTNPATRG